MRYPSWDTFKSNCAETKNKAMESLARILFKDKYGLRESLPYFKNHTGNETDVVEIEGEIIGFQAKYFDNGIDASQVIHSLKEARVYNANQTKVIFYTNKEFGNPKTPKENIAKGQIKKETDAQKHIREEAERLQLQVEWMFGDNILDAVAKNELAYNLFFNPNVDLIHLDEYIRHANDCYLRNIKDTFIHEGQELSVSREMLVNQLAGMLMENQHVIVEGESGSGKSAIVKQYCEQHYDIPVLWLNASQFDTDDVNALFHLEKSFELGQVREYYLGTPKKIIVIDSAEKLTEIKNRMPLSLFLGSMHQDDWQIIFTVRKSAAHAIGRLLRESMQLETETLTIPLLTDECLNDFLHSHQIQIPSDPHLYHRIHNLFYLARYAELPAMGLMTMAEYRKQVWAQKVRGEDIYSLAMQESREQCLLELAKRRLDTGRYYISKDGLDYDAIASLIQDELIAKEGLLGYYFAHDIYLEWATDSLMQVLWNESRNINDFITKVGEGLTAFNAFRRWLAEKIEQSDACVTDIVGSLFEPDTKNELQSCIITEVLRSANYAKTFFVRYEEKLQEKGYQWAVKILNILPVSCQEVQAYITYKGTQYPVMRPIGSGWDCCVNYIYFHHDKLMKVAAKPITTILTDYHKIEKGDKDILHKAGLMALRPHQEIAEARKDKSTAWFDKEQNACRLTANYFAFIHDEINEIIREVTTNKWTDHRDPYGELMHYIVNAEDQSGLPLYAYHPKEVLQLMGLFWSKQEEKEDDEDSWYRRPRYQDMDDAWGLNSAQMPNAYFPASAQQTCIGWIIRLYPQITLDFLIQFIDRCISEYSKSGWVGDKVKTLELVLPNGDKRKKIGNQTAWNLYRGTSGLATPYLLQSIHMALEDYLLTATKNNDTKIVRTCLNTIIDKSESLSLMAIVASIVTAYPDEYYEQLLVMLSNLQFLKYDLMRYSREITVGMIDFAFHHQPKMLQERKDSNALKHRKLHLENILLNLQVVYNQTVTEENIHKLEVVYKIVDSLKEQLKKEPKAERDMTKFILSRCDYRSMKKEKVVVNGVEGIQLTPKLDKRQKEITNQSDNASKKMLFGSSLKLWADDRAHGNFEKAKDYEYDNAPDKALEICKEVIRQQKDKQGEYLLFIGEEYVPPMICAVLIRDYADWLSTGDYDFCAGAVMEAIEDEQFMMSSFMSSYKVLLQAVGQLMVSRPQYSERYKRILLSYADIRYEVGGSRVCNVVSMVVDISKVWEHCPVMMKEAVKTFIETHCKDGDEASLTPEAAESLLCLIAVNNKDEYIRKTAEICLERVSHMWDDNDKRRNLYIGEKHSTSEIVARYVLSCGDRDIKGLLDYFARFLKTNHHDSFLMAFVLRTLMTGNYDKFWNVWLSLYDTIIKERQHRYYDELLNSYMFNPVRFIDWGDDWFKLERKDVEFFARIAEDIGGCPDVLKNTVRVCRTIGKDLLMEFLPVFDKIVAEHPNINLKDSNEDIMLGMDVLMKRVFSEHSGEIVKDEKLHALVERILTFMSERGSSYAANIKLGF